MLEACAHPSQAGGPSPERGSPRWPGLWPGKGHALCCCFTPAPGPATTGVSRGPGICIRHKPQAVLLPWAPASLAERLGERRPLGPRRQETLLPFPSLSLNRSFLLPFACRGRPRRCFLQEVTPPGFDRRLQEFPTDSLCPGQGVFHLYFLFILEPLGAGLPTAATPPSGHTRDCSISSISIAHPCLGVHPPRVPRPREGEEA